MTVEEQHQVLAQPIDTPPRVLPFHRCPECNGSTVIVMFKGRWDIECLHCLVVLAFWEQGWPGWQVVEQVNQSELIEPSDSTDDRNEAEERESQGAYIQAEIVR